MRKAAGREEKRNGRIGGNRRAERNENFCERENGCGGYSTWWEGKDRGTAGKKGVGRCGLWDAEEREGLGKLEERTF